MMRPRSFSRVLLALLLTACAWAAHRHYQVQPFPYIPNARPVSDEAYIAMWCDNQHERTCVLNQKFIVIHDDKDFFRCIRDSAPRSCLFVKSMSVDTTSLFAAIKANPWVLSPECLDSYVWHGTIDSACIFDYQTRPDYQKIPADPASRPRRRRLVGRRSEENKGWVFYDDDLPEQSQPYNPR